MSHLFSSWQLDALRLPNRIVVAPMCQYSASKGTPGDWHLIHLGHLALSGAGLLILEATAVSPEGRISPQDLGLYSDANEAGLARVLAAIRAHSPIEKTVRARVAAPSNTETKCSRTGRALLPRCIRIESPIGAFGGRPSLSSSSSEPQLGLSSHSSSIYSQGRAPTWAMRCRTNRRSVAAASAIGTPGAESGLHSPHSMSSAASSSSPSSSVGASS
jgi:hypothetical protein